MIELVENDVQPHENIPLNRLARADNTDANFPINSLEFRSSVAREVLANLSSTFFEQHVPDSGVSQYTKRASVMRNCKITTKITGID